MPSDFHHAKRQAIAGLVVAVALLGGGLLIQHFARTDSARTKPTATQPSTATYEAAVQEVELRGLYDGTVTLSPSGRSDKIEVKHQGTESGDLKLQSTIRNGRLVLSQSGSCVSGSMERACEARFVVSVPAGIRVTGESAGASVRLERLKGDVKLMNSGDISLRDAGGSIDLRVDTGTVSASGLTGKEVTVTNRNGPIRLAFEEPPRRVRAISQTGDVTVRVPATGSYRVQAASDTSGPRVTVRPDDTSANVIEARTGNGQVTVSN